MKYEVMVTIPLIVTIEAPSPEAAFQQIENNLILNKQIKPCSPIRMELVQEANFEEVTPSTPESSSSTEMT